MSSEPEVSFIAEVLGRAAYEISLARPLFPTYAHLITSALFPIYAGAHASLTRPSSAAKPDKSKIKSRHADDEDEDSEDEEEVQRMEGLSPSDAIVFPIMAGCTLTGLYFLIKWLQDPALLNKILGWYFALFGVFSVSKLIRDSLEFVQNALFPRRYASDGVLWHVHGNESQARVVGETAGKKARLSPLPGIFSKVPLPSALLQVLWTIREVPRQKWVVRLYVHKIAALRAKVGINTIIAAIAGVASVIYFNAIAKPWFLTNLMGFGFSYGALQIMSPTTFATGSLILAALFFYDIYFVFFTPMMVTVAKSLDIPIKLVFPRPPSPSDKTAIPSFAMLGLGDVVLPGIMIGLALRFDLYMFYLKKQTQKPNTDKEDAPPTIVKARYSSVANRWGDNFWTHSFLGRSLISNQSAQPVGAFPKPYFYASLTGYVAGMIATLVVMHVFQHAQPALLYLVPGVLISTWSAAFFRGELKQMWNFSEAVDEDEDEAKCCTKDDAKDAMAQKHNETQGTKSFFSAEKQDRTADLLGQRFLGSVREDKERHAKPGRSDGEQGVKSGTSDKDKTKRALGRNAAQEVFAFSVEAPFALLPATVASVTEKGTVRKDGTVDVDGEPRGKRARHL